MRKNIRLAWTTVATAALVAVALAIALAGCTGSRQSSTSPVSASLDEITSQSKYRTATWGILVVDLATGKTLYQRAPNAWFCPGSTTKLYTGASALAALGPKYRWRTPVYRRGKVGDGGVLAGDLVLVGTGDPTMGGRDWPDGTQVFGAIDHTDAGSDGALEAQLMTTSPVAGLAKLAREVRKGGIRRVRDAAVDDRLFEPYGMGTHAPAYPIAINDNVIDLQATPTQAGAAAKFKWGPKAAGWTARSSVVTTNVGGEPDVAVTVSGSNIVFTGTVPDGYRPVVRTVQVPDPAAFARTLFIQELEKAGVAVNASTEGLNPRGALAASIKSYPKGDRVAQLVSQPASSTVSMALKVSHNVVANTLVLDMGATRGGTTMPDGLAVERSALTSIGADPDAVSLSDGEGGVRSDLISPSGVVGLLSAMSRTKNAKGFRDSLPILGIDGSLAGVVTRSPARGKVWAKTGTTIDADLLNGRGVLIAKGLAGYADTAGGKHVAFAIYVNNLPVASVDEAVAVGGELGAMAAAIQQGF